MARDNPFNSITNQPRREPRERMVPAAARVMMGSLEELAEKANSAGILELDPSVIDPSPFRDRLPDDDDKAFDEFKRSLAEEGQKVPVQVRTHPTSPGRYQLVYGHRRVRAARELNRKVRALPIQISDAELVVAQGIENAARQDLSWIERALFAKTMEDAGIKSREIQAALSTDRVELARLRAVWGIVPLDLIEAIGRAPRIGRPRWQELAKMIELHPERLDGARKMLPAGIISSDDRFQAVLSAFKSKPVSNPDKIDFKIVAANPRGRAFAKFMESRLPALIEEFEQGEH